MVAQKFGKADPDVKAKGSKEIDDKPMKNGPGQKTPYTGMVGDEANAPGGAPDESKTKSNSAQGAASKSGSRESIAPYVEGGFRNKAMEHKR